MKNGKKDKPTRGIGKFSDNDWRDLLTGLKLLAESGAEYLIVGGVACNLHGLARATKDIDVLIPKDIENTEKILKALENLLWGMSREILPEEVIAKPFTIIGDQPRVDLLLVAGKLKFKEAFPRRIEVEIDGIKTPFVSLDDLVLSKQTERPRDKLDLEEIEKLRKISKKLK